jgi:hypothetical protein
VLLFLSCAKPGKWPQDLARPALQGERSVGSKPLENAQPIMEAHQSERRARDKLWEERVGKKLTGHKANNNAQPHTEVERKDFYFIPVHRPPFRVV